MLAGTNKLHGPGHMPSGRVRNPGFEHSVILLHTAWSKELLEKAVV